MNSQGKITVRMNRRWSRCVMWLALLLPILLLRAGDTSATELKKFTLINVVLEGTKIWLPSSITVYLGDEVELTLINKLDEPHGFKIEDFGVEALVQPKSQTSVKFIAQKSGAYRYICTLHPPHIGGDLLVLSKEGP